MTVTERAEKIAAELDQLYVPDGATRFERVAMVRLVEHILILNDRHQLQGAADVLRADHDEPLVPRPGWTLEDEYRALSAEFLKLEAAHERLARRLAGVGDNAIPLRGDTQ